MLVIATVLSAIIKTHSTLAVSALAAIIGLVMVPLSGIRSSPLIITCSVIALVVSLLAIILGNTVELTLSSLFAGEDRIGAPEFGSFISTQEDEDLTSDQTSYHYWAYHMTCLLAICFFGQFMLPSDIMIDSVNSSALYPVMLFCNGISLVLISLLTIWTAVAQIIF